MNTNSVVRQITLLGATLALVFGYATAQAAGDTYTVTTTTDDASNGPNGCTGTAPTYSCVTLRDAMAQANGDTTGPTINFTAGLTGTISLGGELPGLSPAATSPLTIDGTGASISISGAGQYQVMDIYAGTVTINALTIANGGNYGGLGIYPNKGPPVISVTVSNSTFSGNSSSGNGGAILAEVGTLTITNSTFSGNSSGGNGGAIAGENGGITITNSTFSGNSAASGGGAIYTYTQTSISNSTFNNNSVTNGGGGAVVMDGSDESGNLAVDNSTFTLNTATAGGNPIAGSAIYAPAYGAVALYNTIIAAELASPGNNPGNCLAAPNGASQFTDGGGNVSDDPANTCGFGNSNSGFGVPDTGTEGLNLILPLANNGGPTETVALAANSVAVADAVVANCPATDQRGVARPVGGEFGTCSSGAYQYTAGVTAQNGSGTAAGCTSPAICNITGGENQSIAAGTPAAAAALAALPPNQAVITENVCTVAMDPRKICPPGIPSSPYYNSATLPVAAMCPSMPSGGAGNSVVPDYLCGSYGSTGAGSGTGFAVIQGIANGVNGIPGLLDMNDANPDAFFPPGGNAATECNPDGQFIDNISDGWGPWSLSPVEGTIPEGNHIIDLTDGCGGNKQTSGGMSLTLVGVGLNLANATQELGKLPKTLVNFAEYKYANLGLELASDTIDTPNKVELLAILAQGALFLAAGKNGCAEDTLYEADRYVINNASHFHGTPALDPNTYGRTRARILNLFFTLFTRIDGNVNPITDLGPNVGFPLLAPSLSGPPASCSVKYLGKDGY